MSPFILGRPQINSIGCGDYRGRISAPKKTSSILLHRMGEIESQNGAEGRLYVIVLKVAGADQCSHGRNGLFQLPLRTTVYNSS
jgi:hypothetical protein